MGPNRKSPNDDKTVLCHLCMNPTALEIKPPANADHMHWDFGRPSDTWKLSGIIYSTLTVEMCKLNTFTISDTFTPQFSKPVFHSSSWQLVHCIRRPTRTWITFRRFAAVCESVESNLVTVKYCRGFTIHSNQTLGNNCRWTAFCKQKLYNCMLLKSQNFHAQKKYLRWRHDDVIHRNAVIIFLKSLWLTNICLTHATINFDHLFD